MRILSPHRRSAAGFTLVELMVAVGIMALLSALAVPTLRSVVKNSRIRATSVSLQNGLAMARAEAVRLNTRVDFVLSSTGWNVQRADGSLLQQASGREHATGLSISPSSGTVTFDAFGRKTAGPTQINVTATNATGAKPLRIQLTAGGLARLCEPAAASTEPKACL